MGCVIGGIWIWFCLLSVLFRVSVNLIPLCSDCLMIWLSNTLLVRGERLGYYTFWIRSCPITNKKKEYFFYKRFSPSLSHIIPIYVFLGVQAPCNFSFLDFQSSHFNTGRLSITTHLLNISNLVDFIVLIQLQE